MDIRCRKTNCEYNKKYTCTAKEILVDGKVVCSTYQKGDKNEPDTSKTMFERAPEYAPQRDSKTLKIGCKAHCMFNVDGCCNANGITVNDLYEKPFCMSHLPRQKKQNFVLYCFNRKNSCYGQNFEKYFYYDRMDRVIYRICHDSQNSLLCKKYTNYWN